VQSKKWLVAARSKERRDDLDAVGASHSYEAETGCGTIPAVHVDGLTERGKREAGPTLLTCLGIINLFSLAGKCMALT